MNNYNFKRITSNLLNDLIPIFNSAFEKQITSEELNLKFNTFYTPVNFLGYVGYFENTIPCSYYGVYPLYAIINGEKKIISQSGDTMTHKEHVGKGLFYHSAELTYDLCLNNNICGVFGFPSRTSYPGFKKKLEWNFQEKIKKYSFFIPTIPFAFVCSKYKLLNKLYSAWLDFILYFFNKGNIFNGSVINNKQDGILRDELLWKYKLQKKENKLLKILDVNIVLKFNGLIGVGDIDINDETDLAPIIKRLKLLAFLTFNPQLNFFVSPNTLIDQKLSSFCKSKDGLPIGYRDFAKNTSLVNMKYTYFDFDTF